MGRRNRHDWKKNGACVGQPVQIFFEKRYVETALDICRGCEVRRRCYEAGRREEFGVWGGRARGWLWDDEPPEDTVRLGEAG